MSSSAIMRRRIFGNPDPDFIKLFIPVKPVDGIFMRIVLSLMNLEGLVGGAVYRNAAGSPRLSKRMRSNSFLRSMAVLGLIFNCFAICFKVFDAIITLFHQPVKMGFEYMLICLFLSYSLFSIFDEICISNLLLAFCWNNKERTLFLINFFNLNLSRIKILHTDQKNISRGFCSGAFYFYKYKFPFLPT